jgi:DNA-binding NtrC family response regulator
MQRLDNQRILIVEDDEMMREILFDLVSDNGAITSVAENGSVAFDMIMNEKFDAVISDIRMLGGGGVVLVKNISHLKVKPLIFICSGYNDLKNEDFKRLNISAIFEKPFNLNHVINTIKQNLFEKKNE